MNSLAPYAIAASSTVMLAGTPTRNTSAPGPMQVESRISAPIRAQNAPSLSTTDSALAPATMGACLILTMIWPSTYSGAGLCLWTGTTSESANAVGTDGKCSKSGAMLPIAPAWQMSDSARNVKANAATAAIGARLRALVFNTFVPPRGLLSLGKPVKSASPPHVAVVMQSVCTSSTHRQRIETHQDFNTSMTLPSINVGTILACAAGCGAIAPKSRPDTLERNTWCSHRLYRDSSVRVLDCVEDRRQQAVC